MSKKIFNIAVVGSGAISRYHIPPVIENENANLYALCDPVEDVLKARMEEFNISYGVADYRELVNDPKVDAVLVLAADDVHEEITNAFLRAGKPVLLEKPMALTLEECESMLRTQAETGTPLMVGQVCRYNPNFVQAKEIIDSGILGELTFIESEYAHNYGQKHRGVNDWRVNPKREGFIGGGCHAVDLLRWIAGNPTEVCAYSNHKYLTDWPVDDTTVAIMKFPNDVIGKVFVSIGIHRPYTMRTVINGTNGTLIFDAKDDTMTLYAGDRETGKGYSKKQVIPAHATDAHNMAGEVADFLNALIENKPMPIPAIEGASTVAVCRAAVESAHNNGMPQKVKYPEV